MTRRHLWLFLAALLVLGALLAGDPLTPWQYDPVFGSRLIVGLIALALAALTVFAPPFRPIGAGQRTTLSALRLGVVLLVVIFMLRPTCVTTQERRQSAVLVLLFDQSRSMTLPHLSEKKSRWDAQKEILQQNQPILRQLARDLEIKVYAYDEQLHPIDFRDGKIRFPASADGRRTDIGSSLYQAVANERGKRLAGVILLGDGVQTVPGDAPRVEIWEAADELARMDQPLYTVAFGPEGAVADSRDVAVVNLPDQYTVFVKNQLRVRGTLQVRGFRGHQLPVQLLAEDAQGRRQVVGAVWVTPQKDDEQIEVELSYTPPEPGAYRLTMRAVPQERETVVTNNELSAFVTVLGGGLRVLYLEGDLRLEQKFLRRSIDAAQDIELDFQWIDHRLRDRWPIDLADVLRDPQYDAFILGDLDSRALFEKGKQEENLRALVEAVEAGKGLIMLGGFHSFGPGRYGATPLADVLPIQIDKFEAQDFDKPARRDLHVNRPLPMRPTSPHFLTRLAPEHENLRRWQALPPLDGANKFHGVKDRARVLLESPEGVPLLVAGRYGAGRVLAMAGDSTWRWWMQGHQDEHRRFWRQIILWLARRDDLIQDEVWIKLARRRFDPGSRVVFTVGAKTAAGDVIPDATFEAVARLPDGRRQPIELTRSGPQRTGRLDQTSPPGTYTIEVTARRQGKILGTAKGQLMVYDRDVELRTAEADPEQLARLAYQTKGRPVAPEELADLLREIRRRPPELKIEIPKRWQLADTWQDAWFFFLAVVALLTAEWVLRKKWGLV